MNYIWEVLLKAQKEGIAEESIAFVPADYPSPYMETAFDDLNPWELGINEIPVNAWYRFSATFETLLDGSLDAYPEMRDILFDIFLHQLAQLDLREGLCKNEYFGLFLRDDIQKGHFGAEFRDVIERFSFSARRVVTENLVRLYQIGPSIELFRTLLRELYPHSMLYLDTAGRRELLIYIGRKRTKVLAGQLDFLLSTFVPFDIVTQLFWEYHFGIIGIDGTMYMDEVLIY